MARRTLLTWILLLLFTLVAGLFSSNFDYVLVMILALSALKFMGVAFEFMDLKTAHSFWKIALITFLMIFIGIVLIVFESF